MKKKQGKEKKSLRELRLKEQLMVDALPAHNWSVIQAGLAVGYAKSYANGTLVHRAKHDESLSKAIKAKRQAVVRKANKHGWNSQWWRNEVEEALSDVKAAGDNGTRSKLLDMAGKHVGVYQDEAGDKRQAGTQVLVFTGVTPQQALEAVRKSSVSKQLPNYALKIQDNEGVIDAETVDTGDSETPATDTTTHGMPDPPTDPPA